MFENHSQKLCGEVKWISVMTWKDTWNSNIVIPQMQFHLYKFAWFAYSKLTFLNENVSISLTMSLKFQIQNSN